MRNNLFPNSPFLCSLFWNNPFRERLFRSSRMNIRFPNSLCPDFLFLYGNFPNDQ